MAGEVDNDIGQGDVTEQSQDFEWKGESFEAAEFVKSYWAFLGVGILALSVFSMHQYLMAEGIPLSITSSDVVSGLPALFIMIMFSVMSLGISAALPSVILTSRSRLLMRSLLDDMYHQVEEGSARDRNVRIRLSAYWAAGLIFSTIVVTLLICLDLSREWLGFLGSFAIAVFLFLTSGLLVSRLMVPSGWKEHLKAQWGIFLGCSVMQAFVMFSIGAIVESKTEFGFGGMLSIFVLTMAALAVFQIMSAWLVWNAATKPSPLVRIGKVVSIIIIVVFTMPPFNQFFVGYVLMSSATGGRGCTVFTWSENAQVLPELRFDDDASRSVDLRISMVSKDIFYARPWESDTSKGIYLISYDHVARLMKCSADN